MLSARLGAVVHGPGVSHEDPAPERSVPAQRRSRERRDRILEAAALVFAQKGLGGATMDAIAHEAGTSIGSLYRFFRDKEAIFQTLHERHFEEARRFLDAFATDALLLGPWEEVVRGAVDAVFAFTGADPGFRAVWASLSFTGAMLEEGELVNREIAERLSPLIGRMFPRIGETRLPVVCTMLVETVTAMTLVVARRDGDERDAILVECKDLVVRYLAPYADEARPSPRGAVSVKTAVKSTKGSQNVPSPRPPSKKKQVRRAR